jgi:hypothetical protein
MFLNHRKIVLSLRSIVRSARLLHLIEERMCNGKLRLAKWRLLGKLHLARRLRGKQLLLLTSQLPDRCKRMSLRKRTRWEGARY